MPISYKPETLEFLSQLEPKDRSTMDTLLDLIRDTGIDCEARYYQKIVVISRDGMDLFGISPRKQYLSIYVFNLAAKQFLPRLGKVDDGRGCLRIKKLADVDLNVLKEMFDYMLREKINYYGNITK